MGNWDYDNYIVEVNLKDSVTDVRFQTLYKMKPTIKQFDEYCASNIQTIAYNPLAERIVRFFMEYDNGIFLPEKYNNCEPIKRIFDIKDISIPVSYLSFPAGELYLKKRQIIEVSISNEDHAFIWEDGVFLVPRRNVPLFLTNIKCFFSISRNKSIEPIVRLMHDLKGFFNSDSGRVYVQSTHEIIAGGIPPHVSDNETIGP